MAAIRSAIQKEVFNATDERLVGIVNVTKLGRKKKTSFLCLSANVQDSPPQVYISRVKSSEKKASDKSDRETLYRKAKGQTWHLSELRLVDGKSADSEVAEFDLHFDKTTFKWVASSVAEKKAFVTCLYKLVHKYLDRKRPAFVNVDEEKLQDLLRSVDPKTRVGGTEDVEEVQQEEYSELSPEEEADLEELLSREHAIQDAAAFTENLSEELAQLDEANIHALMGSEAQIQQLMSHIDRALFEIDAVETKLSVYDELLTGVRGTMQKLGQHYSRILVENKNLKSLNGEVQELVSKLDLDPHVRYILEDAPLTGASNIRDCIRAANSLQEAVNQELSQGVSILQAVTDQKRFFSALSFSFGRRLHTHLTELFVQQKTRMMEEVQIRHVSSPALHSHSSVHGDLLPYAALMKWMKDCEPQRFAEVLDAYCRNFRKVYEDEIKFFIADTKAALVRGTEVKRAGGILGKMGSNMDISLPFRSPHHGSLMVLSPSSRGGGGRSGLTASVADFSTSGAFGSPDTGNRPKFEQAFQAILEQLQPISMAEQKFCTCFFHFAKAEFPSDFDDKDGIQDQEGEEDIDFGGVSQRPNLVEVGELGGASGLQGVLGQLFSELLPEIEGMITFGERLDNYNVLYLLVSVSQRLMFAQESGSMSYLDETLKKALVFIKRLFDRFKLARKKAIEEQKVPRSGKCGILPCVLEFTRFAERAEGIVMATERRVDLDKAYVMLIDAVFRTIERSALEHPKTPPGVIKFENYKKIVDILSRLKIQCLEQSRDEAKKKSRTHRREYVVNCLGRPLEKLSAFFEGVEGLIATGTKVDEVGYRLDYSRNELKKCVREYPGKEVKKGLDKLYRRVEKDVSEEVLAVVWGAMQEAFMEQFQHFQELINKCYPDSKITLEFTMDDLVEYFSGMAQAR